MGENLNEDKQSSKLYVAKVLIQKIIDLNVDCSYDIMPFNENPEPLCKLDKIGIPEKCTYFSPIVPEIENLLRNTKYDSIIFLSDGLPSESESIAHNAIRMIGNISRENNSNPVAIAIGIDADGEACSLFAGSRGYNCFIKYEKDLDLVVNDVNHGISCVYEILENGLFVPVESDDNYYFLDTKVSSETIKADRKLVEKYLNLVIMNNLMNKTKFPLLKSLVEHSVLLLENVNDRKEIIEKYDEMLKIVENTVSDMIKTPGAKSAVATVFRTNSKQV
jgi:hypothetical protein